MTAHHSHAEGERRGEQQEPEWAGPGRGDLAAQALWLRLVVTPQVGQGKPRVSRSPQGARPSRPRVPYPRGSGVSPPTSARAAAIAKGG